MRRARKFASLRSGACSSCALAQKLRQPMWQGAPLSRRHMVCKVWWREDCTMTLRTISLIALVLLAPLGCASAPTDWDAPPQTGAVIDSSLARARRAEKLATDTELALGERWPAVAAVVVDRVLPLRSLDELLRERGVPDDEAGYAQGEFSDPAAGRLYFAALLLGWPTEAAALRVATRLEAQEMASLESARAELADVDGRLALDALAQASSARVHGFCQRLAALSQTCPALRTRQSLTQTSPLDGPNS